MEPLGTLLDGLVLGTSAPFALVGAAPGTASSGPLPLTTEVPQHWRLRFASDNPFFPHSRWISLTGNGPNESDLRGPLDQDGDGVTDSADNCPTVANADQADADSDGPRREILAALALLGLPLRRRRRSGALGLVLLLFVSASCGGGGGGGGSSSGSRPAAPTNLTATAGDLQVMLAWTELGKATHYGVSRSTTNGGPYTEIAQPATASFTDTGLAGGATYYFVVDAANAAGKSPESSPVAATPTHPGTAAASYSIGITAAIGGATHALSLPLTVQ